MAQFSFQIKIIEVGIGTTEKSATFNAACRLLKRLDE